MDSDAAGYRGVTSSGAHFVGNPERQRRERDVRWEVAAEQRNCNGRVIITMPMCTTTTTALPSHKNCRQPMKED